MEPCALCGSLDELERHHLVPRSAVAAIQPRPTALASWTIKVCPSCHKRIHEVFLDHLRLSGKVEGFEDVDIYGYIKYQLIKRFLKEKDPMRYKEWRAFLDEFNESVFKEIEAEGDDGWRGYKVREVR